MTPVDKLIQSIHQTLDNSSPSQNADKLAAEYVHWCATANRRLEQCERLLEGKAEHEALQLAETPPSLLDLCAALSFDKAEQWRGFCRTKGLPLAEELNERAISQLNDLYSKGITSSHPLYRDYRRAVAERDDVRALSIIRAIVRLNPTDANARHEIHRLEEKEREAACGRLLKAVQSRDSSEILSTLEVVESAGWSGTVNSVILNQARAIRQERDRELAFERCCGLVAVLDRLKDREAWNEALGPIREVEQLCAEHGITLSTDAAQTFDEVRTWALNLKKTHETEQRFEAALRNMAFLVDKGEASDGPSAAHDLQSFREEQHALINQWRELESFAKPVPADLQTRVKRRSAVLQAEVGRLVRQRRLITTVGIASVVIVAGISTIMLFRWRWTNSQISELEKLQQERRVVASEKFIADLLRNEPKAVANSGLALEIQKADQWIKTEHQRVETFQGMLGKIERHQQSGFKDATIEIIGKDWQQVGDFKKELAPEFRNTGEAQFLEFENQFGAVMQALKQDAETTFQAELRRADEATAALKQGDLTLPSTRKTVTTLVSTLENLEKLASPSAVKLPASLTSRVAPLRTTVAPYEEALVKLDKADVAMRQATTLEQYYSALEGYDAEYLRQLPEVRAARKIGTAKLSLMEVERLLLMPGDLDGWAVFLKNPTVSGLPKNVMPAELSSWLSLRDDDNLRDIYRYDIPRVTQRPPLQTQFIYSRGPLVKLSSSVDSLGGRFQFLATIFIPSPQEQTATFAKQQAYMCNHPTAEGEIVTLPGGMSSETVLIGKIGLPELIDSNGEKFKKSVNVMLDELRADEKVNPVFKAYLHWRLLEIEGIRPLEWGARIVPSIESDRAELKELGVAEIRSGDWMVPIQVQRWGTKLTGFYNRTRTASYTKQARFFERLLSDAHLAGIKYAGYIGTDGTLILTSEGSRSQRLWGLSEDGLRLIMLGSGDSNGSTKPAKAQPMSPVFVCGREPAELLSAASEKAQIDWHLGAIRTYLSPLFQGEFKP